MPLQRPASELQRVFAHACVAFAMMFCAPGLLIADVMITQLANEGVILSDGKTRIMIDGMVVEPYSIYGGLDEAAAADFSRASGAFAGIELALSSHRHHDHNQPRFACQFLRASLRTEFVSSPQVLGLMREKCRQPLTTEPRIREIAPQYGQPEVLQHGEVKITVFPLSHGTRKFAKIQNYGHLVEMGGMKILHIGDAAMDPADFRKAGMDQVKLDVAFIPFWYFKPGPGPEVIDQFLDASLKVAVHIPPGEMEEVRVYMREFYPRVKVMRGPLEELGFSSIAQPEQ